MTLREVKAATASLAFAEELADLDSAAEAGFYPALARAIWTTDALRPTLRVIHIRHVYPYEDAQEVTERDVLYDLRQFASDIASVTEAPGILRDGAVEPLTSDYVVSGGYRLYLSRALEGDVRICCRIRPRVPDETTDPDTPLSPDEELCQMIPLLTAHYLILDDDAERAAHYLSLYREMYALVKAGDSPPAAVSYRSVNNW